MAAWQRQLPRSAIKADPLLPTVPCDPHSPWRPLVSGSKVAPRDFAAILSQLPVGLSCWGYPVVEKRQAAYKDPAAVMMQVRRLSNKWKMKIHRLLNTCQGSCTWPHEFGPMEAAVGVNPVAADGRGSQQETVVGSWVSSTAIVSLGIEGF